METGVVCLGAGSRNCSLRLWQPGPIIRGMIAWTWQSNVCDVLGLGPRAAGSLARVGIYSVDDLLAVSPALVEVRLKDKKLSAETIGDWQREARLVVLLPELPPEAARLLAAAGYSCPEQIARCAPTELVIAYETLKQEHKHAAWVTDMKQPGIAEFCAWITCAKKSLHQHAA